MTIEQHRRLHLLLRFVMLFALGAVLYVVQPPGLWGLLAFLALGVMVFFGATFIAMRIPARCEVYACQGPTQLRHLERHHWYVCERCGDRQDGGSQRMGPYP